MINLGAGMLLRLLASGIRPDGASGAAPQPAVEGKDFASLLADVRAGRVSSGRPVEIGPNADVELTEGQLERLAVVADAAEAAGASRVAVRIDDQVVTLDVLTRMVEGAQGADSHSVLTGIDAFVTAPAEAGGSGVPVETGRGGATDGGTGLVGLGRVENPWVAELLSGLSERSGSAA